MHIISYFIKEYPVRISRSHPVSTRRSGATWFDVLTTLFCLLVGTLLCMAWVGCGVGGGAREASQRAVCMTRIRFVGLAFHNYRDIFKTFPPGSTSRASWPSYLLPFIDGASALDERLDPRHGTSAIADKTNIAMFLCPANSEANAMDGGIAYLASSGRQHPQEPMDPELRGVFRDESYDENGRLQENVTDPSRSDYRGWSRHGNYFTFRQNTDGVS